MKVNITIRESGQMVHLKGKYRCNKCGTTKEYEIRDECEFCECKNTDSKWIWVVPGNE